MPFEKKKKVVDDVKRKKTIAYTTVSNKNSKIV